MASHAGIFRGARLSSRDERQAPLKTLASGASKRRNVQHFEMSVSIKIIRYYLHSFPRRNSPQRSTNSILFKPIKEVCFGS